MCQADGNLKWSYFGPSQRRVYCVFTFLRKTPCECLLMSPDQEALPIVYTMCLSLQLTFLIILSFPHPFLLDLLVFSFVRSTNSFSCFLQRWLPDLESVLSMSLYLIGIFMVRRRVLLGWYFYPRVDLCCE